jgi:hypothetical protein
MNLSGTENRLYEFGVAAAPGYIDAKFRRTHEKPNLDRARNQTTKP